MRLLTASIGFLLAISVVIMLMLLNPARQSSAQPAARVFVTDYGDGLNLYRRWQGAAHPDDVRPLSTRTYKLRRFRSLAWSPDGQWIAYVDQSLTIVRAHGGKTIPLTDTIDGAVSWSPDSQALLFQSYRDNNWDIYLLRLDDNQAQRLTDHPADDFSPVWSPDGQWIAFASQRNGNWEIYRLEVTSGDIEQLTFTNQWEQSPRFTADGEWIEFEVVRDRFARMRPDGSDRQLLPDDHYGAVSRALAPVIDLPLNKRLLAGISAGLIAWSFLIWRLIK